MECKIDFKNNDKQKTFGVLCCYDKTKKAKIVYDVWVKTRITRRNKRLCKQVFYTKPVQKTLTQGKLLDGK